jgi:hypothetical protein
MTSTAAAAAESFIGTGRTFDETKDLVRDALTARVKQATGALYGYVYIADISDTDVVYTCADDDDLMQCSYAIGTDSAVTLGDPVEVVRTYAPAATVRNPPPEADAPAADGDAEQVMESTRVAGRVVEAKGTDATGGRVFRTRIIAYGDSKNGRRYPEAVLREAVGLYEGAKAYDHHRTVEELQTSTITGLVGHYRDVQAEADGLYGDLHLLPSATHTAEVLDASLAAQDAGLEPSVGISHDVQCHFKPIVEAGRRIQEAVQVASVDSADVVAKPSAGGKAVRAVAGGTTTTEEESDVPTKADVLAAFKEATDDELAAVGLARAATKTIESTTTPQTSLQRATEAAETARESDAQPKTSFLGKMLIRSKLEDAGLPVAVTESVTAALPDRITEADVDVQIAGIKAGLGLIERHELRPTVTATVAQESQEKKIAALDAFFAGDYGNGYRSFREAFCDFTGQAPRTWGEDFNKTIMRECVGAYDSDGRIRRSTEGVERTTESLSASSWNLVLGDSITRRLVAEYNQPNLMTWRQIVSSIVPVNDFRTQRVDRIGGYGVLPTVNQGAPYQPLTSPTNEEVTYAITKKGGTEDVTLEMIANDDVRAISRIPKKLGLAAAQTLYRFVWDFLNTNATLYDSVALFNAGQHLNDGGAGRVLTQSGLSAARAALRAQTAYGDTKDILSIVPRTLVVPTALEEIAYQLSTSAVAIPGTVNTGNVAAAAANTPNIHQGIQPIVVDYFNATSAAAWYVVADPAMCPTIEVGFYLGREDPELFTQSDPTVGSVFNADTVTYKIRHIYSGAVLDWRGFQRAGI